MIRSEGDFNPIVLKEGGLDAIAEFWNNPIPVELPVSHDEISHLEVTTSEVKKEMNEKTLDEYINYCLSCETVEDFEAFYGLAGFKALFSQVMAKMRLAADQIQNAQTKELVIKKCDRLVEWENQVKPNYPSNQFSYGGEGLSSLELLQRSQTKKEAKKEGKKNGKK